MSTLNLYLDKKSENSLDELQELLDAPSKAETIRKALTITQILSEYKKQGFTINLEKGKEKKEVIIV